MADGRHLKKSKNLNIFTTLSYTSSHLKTWFHVQFLQGAKFITELFQTWFRVQLFHVFCMQHAAILAGFPTWRACNLCSVLHAKIACNDCTWNHGINWTKLVWVRCPVLFNLVDMSDVNAPLEKSRRLRWKSGWNRNTVISAWHHCNDIANWIIIDRLT